jgi:hypothetical protein
MYASINAVPPIGSEIELQRARRVDEAILRDLPEILVPVHQAAQQRVLQLLGAPHGRQRHAIAGKHLFAQRGHGKDVEQRSVGIEGERVDGR